MKKLIKWLKSEDTSDPFYAAGKNWVALIAWVIMAGVVIGGLIFILCTQGCCTGPSYYVVERDGYFMIETRGYSVRLERCRWKDREKAELMCSMLIRMENRRR